MKNKEIEKLLNEHNYPVSDCYLYYKKDINLLLSYIEQLEKENDRLKKDYSIIVNENCDYLLLEKKVEQLENNRDKAIKYVKMHSNALGVLDTIKNYTLLDILGDGNGD